MDYERLIALLALCWAALLLFLQFTAGRRTAYRDFAAPAGSPFRGMVYAFTVGMLPAHKETVRKHPVKFLVGVTMHAGVLAAMLMALLDIAFPANEAVYPPVTVPFLALCAACGVYLFGRRIVSGNLRAMSCFDDYLASSATTAFIGLAALVELGLVGRPVFLLCFALLLLYLPLGKLRHALFFFVARADYGRRLGYRGVYPPGDGRANLG